MSLCIFDNGAVEIEGFYMRVSRAFRLTCCLSAAFAICGCVTPPPFLKPFSFVRPTGKTQQTPKVHAIYIGTIADDRPLKDGADIHSPLVTLIPLVPYAHSRISPEYAWPLDGREFKSDLRDAIVRDLNASGLATSVVGSDEGHDGTIRRSAYLLDVTIQEAVWHHYQTLYGISIFGICLQYLGAPEVFMQWELALQFELKDPSGATVSSTVLEWHSRDSLTAGICRKRVDTLAQCISQSYQDISPQLRNFVAKALDDSIAKDGVQGLPPHGGNGNPLDNAIPRVPERAIVAEDNVHTPTPRFSISAHIEDDPSKGQAILGNADGRIQNGEAFDLMVVITNASTSTAKAVTCTVSLPADRALIAFGQLQYSVPELAPAAAATNRINLAMPLTATSTQAPVCVIEVKETGSNEVERLDFVVPAELP